MKKLEKVDKLEVKRCFLVAQLVRKQKFTNLLIQLIHFLFKRGFLKDISLEDFNEKLKKAQKRVLQMEEKELDKIIKKEWKKRLVAYNNSDWFLCEINPEDAGVWRRAGELPLSWTNDSLTETAQKVNQAIKTNSKDFGKCRAKYTIRNILKTNIKQLQSEKYLFPIMFQCDTGTKGRKRLKRKMKYDIDDGCMRSIALTISGVKEIKAYVGFPKNNEV